jgi:hypothetical protein
MRARIDTAVGPYWVGIVRAAEVVAAISALGAIGGIPALLSALSLYTRSAMMWLRR